MQKLKAPAGMTDVSFGGQNYKVGDDGGRAELFCRYLARRPRAEVTWA